MKMIDQNKLIVFTSVDITDKLETLDAGLFVFSYGEMSCTVMEIIAIKNVLALTGYNAKLIYEIVDPNENAATYLAMLSTTDYIYRIKDKKVRNQIISLARKIFRLDMSYNNIRIEIPFVIDALVQIGTSNIPKNKFYLRRFCNDKTSVINNVSSFSQSLKNTVDSAIKVFQEKFQIYPIP